LIAKEPRAVEDHKPPSLIKEPEQPNARHHPPRRVIEFKGSAERGRVHAVVMLRRINGLLRYRYGLLYSRNIPSRFDFNCPSNF
jgi:hypothetical protein